jgi:hypothetical protein
MEMTAETQSGAEEESGANGKARNPEIRLSGFLVFWFSVFLCVLRASAVKNPIATTY